MTFVVRYYGFLFIESISLILILIQTFHQSTPSIIVLDLYPTHLTFSSYIPNTI